MQEGTRWKYSKQDGVNTLFYCDPPYYPTTRVSSKVYAHEMSIEEHKQLLCCIVRCKGKVMISGYSCRVYEEMLDSWNRHEFDLPNNAAGGEEKRRMQEVVWCNF